MEESNGGGGKSGSSTPYSNLLSALLVHKKPPKGRNKEAVVSRGEEPHHERLRKVASETSKIMKGPNTPTPNGFSDPARRSLLGLLGVCRTTITGSREDVLTKGGLAITFRGEDKFNTSDYESADVFAIKIGAGTALDRIVKDYKHIRPQVEQRLKAPHPRLPTLTLLLPQADPTATALWQIIGEFSHTIPPQVDGRQPPWNVWVDPMAPGCFRDVYIRLLSMHLRLLARPQQAPEAPQPWTSDDILNPPDLQLPGDIENINVHAEVYIFARTLHFNLSGQGQGALEATVWSIGQNANEAAAEENWIMSKQRAAQQGQGQQNPPPPAQLKIADDIPVVHYLLSRTLTTLPTNQQTQELHKFAGVYVLLPTPCPLTANLRYARLPDSFSTDSDDGPSPFSRLGQDLTSALAGLSHGPIKGPVESGLRVARVAVSEKVAALYPGKVTKERPSIVLEFGPQGGGLQRVVDEQGQTVDMPTTLEVALKQILKRDLALSGWYLHFHKYAADKAPSPLPTPTLPMSRQEDRKSGDEATDMDTDDGGQPSSYQSPMTGGGGGAALPDNQEGQSDKVCGKSGALEPGCINGLTSGDLAALLMADYFWSGAFKLANPHTLTPPLPVVIELPRALLMRVFVEEVEREVYKYLLGGGQADTGAPTFFLQDFLTLMNAFGQQGDVITTLDTFLGQELRVLYERRELAETFARTLAAQRLEPRTQPTTTRNVVTISLSSSEAATLTMHVYWRYHDETTEMHMRLKYDKDAQGHEALLTIIPRIQLELPGSVELRDVMAVADFFTTGTGATGDSHNALLRRYREGQVHEVAVKPTRYIQRAGRGRARQN